MSTSKAIQGGGWFMARRVMGIVAVLCLILVAVGCFKPRRRSRMRMRPPVAQTQPRMAPTRPIQAEPAPATNPELQRAPIRTRTRGVATAGVVGGLYWHDNLADARSAARREGKLILLVATKDRCTLCKRFRSDIVRRSIERVSELCVGYVYDITNPEDDGIDALVRANLGDARLMPLVGFLTPKLEWVHGFWGRRRSREFDADLDRVGKIQSAPANATPARDW